MTSYATKDDVKAQVGYTLITYDDALEDQIIPAVSAAIDRYTNRPDGFVAAAVATARLFSGSGDGVLRIDEAALITGVGVKASTTDTVYTAWDADDWLAFGGDPSNPDFNHAPYTYLMAAAGTGLRFTGSWASDEMSWPSGRMGGISRSRRAAGPTVSITARWGYALTVPPQIMQACIVESARMFKQAQSNFAETLVGMELGQLIQTAKLHPSTELILKQGRFIRPAVG